MFFLTFYAVNQTSQNKYLDKAYTKSNCLIALDNQFRR